MTHAAADVLSELYAARKPVFLTKAQREELNFNRRREEIEQKRRRQQLLHHSNRPYPAADSSSRPPSPDRDRDRDGDRERERYGRERDRERDHRDSERRKRDRERDEEQKKREEKARNRKREIELEAIREQYLGSKELKKRVIKPREKFRFSLLKKKKSPVSLSPFFQNIPTK